MGKVNKVGAFSIRTEFDAMSPVSAIKDIVGTFKGDFRDHYKFHITCGECFKSFSKVMPKGAWNATCPGCKSINVWTYG